jgi:diadenosine tetraphosphate (Ap4A) HIT family hydrolase
MSYKDNIETASFHPSDDVEMANCEEEIVKHKESTLSQLDQKEVEEGWTMVMPKRSHHKNQKKIP